MKSRFNLFDTFREKNELKKEYSWEKLNPDIIKERIDLIFLSNSLKDYVVETGIIPVYKTCSDHGIPFVTIKGFGIPSRGPGVWKLNNELLNEPLYVSELKEKIGAWIHEAESDLPGNMGSQWGYLKHKIGEYSREFGAKLKKAKLLLKSKIETELNEISNNLNEENKEEYKILQNNLNEIIENEVQGSILRSLCQEYEAGEKCTKYFFLLEKFKAKQKTISRLVINDGSFTSDQK